VGDYAFGAFRRIWFQDTEIIVEERI